MHLLLIHQNFPGQFRDLAPAWLTSGHSISAIGAADPPEDERQWDGLQYHQYSLPDNTSPSPQERGRAIASVCRKLQQQGCRPDLLIAHSAWGEALQLHQLFTDIPRILLPELWGTPRALGDGFDRSRQGPRPRQELFARQNLLAELAIVHSTTTLVASQSQRNSFPIALQEQITVLPEGLDLRQYKADQEANVQLPGLEIRAGQPLVTLISRNLEPLRGLRQALKAWPDVAKAVPDALLLLIGDTESGYGDEEPNGDSHLDDALAALPAEVNRGRIHHLGWLEHNTMLKVMQCSACHLALSYPYTLSWSVLEAMACAAPLITNHGSPISPELTDQRNALIVPFNDSEALTEAMLRLLESSDLQRALGEGARTVIAERFNLANTLPAYEQLFARLTHHALEANQPSS